MLYYLINSVTNEVLMKKLLFLFAALFAALSLLAADGRYSEKIDYSDTANWIAIGKQEFPTGADVFYVYPTLISGKAHPYMDWSIAAVREKTIRFAGTQLDIFLPFARIYAPFYRQGEYTRAIADVHLPVEKQKWLQLGISDVKQAFRYYIKHHNKGRPFFLFGHSQGAMALLELVKTELADPEINRLFVAGYLIGYPKMPASYPDHPHIRTAKSADDTGVILTWNCETRNAGKSLFTEKGFYCINPLNWRTDEVKAQAADHPGARFYSGRKFVDHPRFCSAQISLSKGALVVESEDLFTHQTLKSSSGILHGQDVFFFFHSIRKNAQLRLKAYEKNFVPNMGR